MTAFFKELPIETVVKLKKLYQNDFTRFGYTFDLKNMTAGDEIDWDLSVCNVIKVLMMS